ncbi:MAG: IS110 family transposase [Methanobrevibacter sp.]|uniref:IS110 family transposase n=1 Tax=Methanobrevibacter sp. TaxID=66852 RepID=UPI003F104320
MFDYNQTLFVGIDVSKDSNQVCLINFEREKLLNKSFKNNFKGAIEMKTTIISYLSKHNFSYLIIVLESTGIYSIHIANFLSNEAESLCSKTEVYLLNPITSYNFSKSNVGSVKNDPMDAFALADFAASGKTKKLIPFKANQHFAIQSLARQRKHYIDLLCKEKTRILNYIFIKFSDFNNAKHQNKSFSNVFCNTSIEVLLNYKTPEDIANSSIEDLTKFIKEKSKNRFDDCEEVAKILQKASRDSYRLDATIYDSVNTNISICYSTIKFYEEIIKTIEKEINTLIKGSTYENDISILKSIPGISNIFATSIISELGDVSSFKSDDALAKYAGIYWSESDSGNFISEDHRLKKTGNSYLRYYLIEATSSVIRNNHVFNDFYQKKLKEVKTHKESRALILTSRKFIRLIFKLLKDKKLYSFPTNNN